MTDAGPWSIVGIGVVGAVEKLDMGLGFHASLHVQVTGRRTKVTGLTPMA